jgi:hypothetical protein
MISSLVSFGGSDAASSFENAEIEGFKGCRKLSQMVSNQKP